MNNKKDLWLVRSKNFYAVFFGKCPWRTAHGDWFNGGSNRCICKRAFHAIFADRLKPNGGPILWKAKVK